MLIKYLQYRYVKARMMAYLDGELSLQTRRFIARQIDENPLCYREYISAKQTHQELKQSLPTFGTAQDSQLNAIWATIQQEMTQPAPISTPQRTRLQPSYRLSYSVALLVLGIILLAPFAIDVSRSQPVPIAQPLPDDTLEITLPASTPEADSQMIAFAVETYAQIGATSRPNIPLQNTPAPQTPRS
ncbi:MAG: hypothetical protein AAF846_06315 [Chloroflexota bacterium]